MQNKHLKTVFIPLQDTSALMMPPFTINSIRLYQLVDNEEKEQWQLIITKID